MVDSTEPAQSLDQINPPKNLASRSKPLQQRLLRWFIIYAAIPYLSVVLIFVSLQRKLMYQPTVAANLSLQELQLDSNFGKDIQLVTADGNTLLGWLVKGRSREQHQTTSNPLVIYFPGNSLNRHKRISDLREIAGRGFDVLIFDYRGFGDSSGNPSEQALSDDALLIWQLAVDTLNYAEDQTVIFGESLGGAVALSLWDRSRKTSPNPAAVVLNSTFASMPKTVRWLYPWFPFDRLLLDRWPSIERIKNVTSPIVIFHGTEDQMVPVAHARQLNQIAQNSKLIEVQGGTHNEIPTMKLRRELDFIWDQMFNLPGAAKF